VSELSGTGAVVLVECGSPIIYKLTKAALYNKLRWMIWNSYATGVLTQFVPYMLVSPSSTWKHSFKEKELHRVLDITGDNKHIRDCRAMVAMHAKHPEDWVHITDYMEGL
jgi:hypothetical protein